MWLSGTGVELLCKGTLHGGHVWLQAASVVLPFELVSAVACDVMS
jgi:hypothetical protein